jgi:hypothetical protein
LFCSLTPLGGLHPLVADLVHVSWCTYVHPLTYHASCSMVMIEHVVLLGASWASPENGQFFGLRDWVLGEEVRRTGDDDTQPAKLRYRTADPAPEPMMVSPVPRSKPLRLVTPIEGRFYPSSCTPYVLHMRPNHHVGPKAQRIFRRRRQPKPLRYDRTKYRIAFGIRRVIYPSPRRTIMPSIGQIGRI